MLLYYVARDTDLDAVAARGVAAPPDEPLSLWTSMDAVPDDASTVLVVDASGLDGPPRRATRRRVDVDRVPASAFRNVDPYRPPVEVRAGGGYVVCPVDGAEGDALDAAAVAVLLIHRRGVWDLPKGKQDPGETIEACAAREVREEVGIDRLRVLRSLGTTQHGYVDGDAYAVKTTTWYLMRTVERTFEPERREGIRRVAWARWPVARRHLGYETLQTHMDRVASDVVSGLRADEAPS